ncbi:hypothetical protein KXV68_002194 [Aspergillus fumigatus]|nr:hypothetical protein KXX17_005780 [Aspergillus fumigatus]KAH1737012.1 hypothetical protein KXX25_003362 [Aspergillus fumigatus]KAH2147583.1 hypothetical protein KXV68_002194 [Aspergillus fumigatus]KAH2162927.1 hypothetical protein KXW33_008576 [Aspergillus fumigatus]KAH2395275.1 hypothetical protein KXV62_007844 [Aspergillus fumigatus]
MATTFAYERFPFHEPGSGPDSHFTTPESSLGGKSTAYKTHHNDGLRRSSMGKCLLQWFWSTLMIDGSSPQDSQAKPSDLRRGEHHGQARKGSTFNTQGTSAAEQSHDDKDEENPACKACRTWGVMEAKYTRLAETICQKANAHSKRRFLVAIAGIPGSGKTTTAVAVARLLNTQPSPKRTTLLSMDGFHLSRATLDLLPNREEAYIRRGAPWTFDAARFVQFIRRLRNWADSTPCASAETIYAPSFDHEAKDPVENGIAITDDTEIVIIEGNYLLLDEPEWREVAALVDYRVFVESDLQEARERVARRHVLAGIEKTLEDGFRRVDRNDYLNAITIQEKLITPDLVIHSVTEPTAGYS